MKRNLAKYQWEYPKDRGLDWQTFQAEVKQAGASYHPAFLELAYNRGLDTYTKLKQATDQEPQIFHDPYLFYQMDLAVNRLQEAIANQEQITIYGDYDADGITSTLIMYEALESLGARVNYYLPNRFTDGYGPNLERYQELVEAGTELILTVDNGVAGYEAVSWAKQAGIDVIITDHHEMQGDLPEAYAIIHPRHPQGQYPFGDLAGAGVALKLASALLDEIPVEALELAAIGTVADLVPLTDENRTIVLSGLSLMKATSRLGLARLLASQNINSEDIDEDTIAFIIAPRLNSLGRLGDPTPGLELLASFDEGLVDQLVDQTNQVNQERKDLVDQIYEESRTLIEKTQERPSILILSGKDWSQGVLGIVASRLVEHYQRPALVFQYNGDSNEYKGSGRSIPGVDLFQLLSQNSSLLKAFGGHEQAAGLTIGSENWEAFKTTILSQADGFQAQIQKPEVKKIDLVLNPEDVTLDLIEEINQLGPFGMGNERPLIAIDQAQVQKINFIGSQRNHVKLSISSSDQSNSLLTAIGFSKADQAQDIQENQQINLLGQLSINEWQSQKSAQLLIEDLSIEGNQWIDWRSSRLSPDIFTLEEALYVFRHQRLLDYYQDKIPSSSMAMLYNQDQEIPSHIESLVIVEAPKDLGYLNKLLALDLAKVYLVSYVQESKYLAGAPSRPDLIKLYAYCKQVNQFEIRPQLASISSQLKLSQTKLKIMFLMFLEAGFVTIKDGWLEMNRVTTNQKVDLTQLDSYKDYLKMMEIEELLNYQSLADIKDYFEGKIQDD
ncbi:single-stranded-DNA-specific exonuclease RecJ [Hutsoniella sourekii]|uniref:single-stranded-DNA-specific exonuclease RecJ n=1 Tax=Hutsoniella sourekii TaxID=87650 RepID=UPI00048704A5|nr:single-stranded-DNA-specific exonuclease RecJ [Hutsoniella sourekii]